MLAQLKARVSACNEQGKKTPKSINLTMREIEQINALRELTGGSEFTEVRLTKLYTRLEEQVSALESKEIKSTSVTVLGEKHLDMDSLLRKVNRYAKEVYNLAMVRQDMARRIKEHEETLKNIESNIPMSQAAEFKRLLTDISKSDIDFLSLEGE